MGMALGRGESMKSPVVLCCHPSRAIAAAALLSPCSDCAYGWALPFPLPSSTLLAAGEVAD